jgi:RNA methyltransferase, TrmH family
MVFGIFSGKCNLNWQKATIKDTTNKNANKMLSASQIKYIKSLSQQKFRKQHGKFIIEGEKMVAELMSSGFEVEAVYAVDDWLTHAEKLPGCKPSLMHRVSPSELGRISSLKTPNKALAVVNIPTFTLEKEVFDGLVLALDRISDPGNLGTIIRVADWFGIRHIMCSPDTVELFNPKVVQATMGSLFRVKVHYVDLEETITKMADEVPKFAATLDGDNIYTQKLPQKAVVIVGNESHGISESLIGLADHKLTIPSAAGSAESLNASIATAIICSEFKKSLFLQV